MSTLRPKRKRKIEYPTEDGQPMGETPLHRTVMADLIVNLEVRYLKVPDVWAGGNLFLCYEEGNPEACVVPDVLLAKGVRKWPRPNYLLWQETPPSLIVEVTSEKTRKEDEDKKSLYERLGVEELILFDPYGEYLQPRLQGYELLAGRYQPIPRKADGSLLSRTTNLFLEPERDRLRLVDAETRERLVWLEEIEPAFCVERVARHAEEALAAEEAAARQAAEARAAEEIAARQAAEEQVRALKAELERLRKA
ncbi:MAG TPA: Uma2 family endonuclease [Thermoanaerobaculia bacterium]|nr:Uma2 family endonuclease [Thermoanaerobaculia bacterium]